MKRARQKRPKHLSLLKPRNPWVALAQQKKAGAHQRRDRHAVRAHQQRQFRKRLTEE